MHESLSTCTCISMHERTRTTWKTTAGSLVSGGFVLLTVLQMLLLLLKHRMAHMTVRLMGVIVIHVSNGSIMGKLLVAITWLEYNKQKTSQKRLRQQQQQQQ